MTLQRRLLFAVTVLILFLFGANLVITLYNARLNIYEQLKVHAQDTATALGFSMSQAALDKDDVQISLMIDAIFNRGYYRRITYYDLDGNEKVKRELSLDVADVPQWFMKWLPLPEPSGDALVNSGWFQLGQVRVVSHPGFAYQDLWRSFKEQLWLFLVTNVICYALLALGLRYVLRPLRRVEAQAEAICRKEFTVQDTLPGIPELSSVVTAMNRMVAKLREMFQYHIELNDELYQKLNTDMVTGLPNRQYFDRELSAYIKSESVAATGVLVLIQVADLIHINREIGRERGDEYLCSIAETLVAELENYPDTLTSRHSGADFAIFVPAIDEVESQELMDKIFSALQELDWNNEKLKTIYLGALFITNLPASKNLMALADIALGKAQNERTGGCYWYKTDKQERTLSANEWCQLMSQAIEERSIQLHYQPVWQSVHGERTLLFNEVTISMVLEDKTYPAGFFMPLATRFQLLPDIDQLVIECILDEQDRLPEKICINLSVASIENKVFIAFLKQVLSDNPVLASRLVFEIPANALSFAEKAVREFSELITHYGSALSLQHFGKGTSEFAYLQTLAVDYLKIDRSFIHQVEKNVDARFFIRSLVGIAKSCDLVMLAEGVETQEQWQELLELGVHGGQGYWLGRPSVDPTVA